MKIAWTNKYSGERGFVKELNEDKKDFINTVSENEAADFRTANAEEVIKSLEVNQPQNSYEVVRGKTVGRIDKVSKVNSGEVVVDIHRMNRNLEKQKEAKRKALASKTEPNKPAEKKRKPSSAKKPKKGIDNAGSNAKSETENVTETAKKETEKNG